MKKLLVPLILICALLVPVGMLGGISCLWNLETLYVQVSMAIARHCFPIP